MIEIKSGQLQPAITALSDLANNRVPYRVARGLRRLLKELQEWYEPWQQEMNPFIEKYGEEGSIQTRGPRWDAFVEATDYLMHDVISLKSPPMEYGDWLLTCDISVINLNILGDLGLLKE